VRVLSEEEVLQVGAHVPLPCGMSMAVKTTHTCCETVACKRGPWRSKPLQRDPRLVAATECALFVSIRCVVAADHSLCTVVSLQPCTHNCLACLLCTRTGFHGCRKHHRGGT
jgi:hypothetical protein